MEIELLYQALASPIGIVVSTCDINLAVQRFYQARKKCGDPALDCLQVRRSPYLPDEELWIVKGAEPKEK